MSDTTDRLKLLRGWFVAYYVVQSIIGTVVAMWMLQSLSMSSMSMVQAFQGFSPTLTVVSSIGGCIVILMLALFFFSQLLQRKNWARVTMLIIAWLTAIGSCTSLLSVGAVGLLARLVPNVDWGMLRLISIVTNLTSLAISVYMIRTLQYDREIRSEFVPAPPQ
jgi:hypothetical protein